MIKIRHSWLQAVLGLILLLMLMLTSLPTRASTSTTIYLPIVSTLPGPPSTFGFDVREYYDDRVLGYAREANPRWVRAGGILHGRGLSACAVPMIGVCWPMSTRMCYGYGSLALSQW